VITQETPDNEHRLEDLKSRLKAAYKAVEKANRALHRSNKRLYDRKAKTRHFETEDLIYLHNPSVKPGLTKKFLKPWTGPFQVTARLSELNYEIMDHNKMPVVHINMLKRPTIQICGNLKQNKPVKNPSKTQMEFTDDNEEN
jgi:hypothetical protein